MIRNVLLDWSGTLADDLSAVLRATNLIFREYGRGEMTREEFRRHFRLPFSGFYAEFLPEATTEGLESLYERFFAGLQLDIPLLPGAREFLEFLQATNRRMFLLSSIKAAHFEHQAVNLGVRGFFEHAYVEVMDKREKIREILQVHGLDPAETMFVGDMIHDIETARHGGVLDVAVATGFDPVEKLIPSRPSILAVDLFALRRLVE
ncbi:MAG: HAD hydrolase-like protein [Terrimicrobiaceae bacterium]|nr:HAD hydrolase-like protein [Terrimicrobiaceae bacterium]